MKAPLFVKCMGATFVLAALLALGLASADEPAASWNGVLIGPGEIDSAQMPCVAYSRATPSVIDTTAPLAAA